MEDAARTPVHLWVVGLVSTFWNAFGAFDYVMTQTRNSAYLSHFSAEDRAYFESYPAWMEGAWALGVWGALAGSVLLLGRSRHAVFAFAVSLLGLLVSTIYQFAFTTPPAAMTSGPMLAVNLAIWAIAIALFLYAYRMRERGILR